MQDKSKMIQPFKVFSKNWRSYLSLNYQVYVKNRPRVGSKPLPMQLPSEMVGKTPADLMKELKTTGVIALSGLISESDLKKAAEEVDRAFKGTHSKVKAKKCDKTFIGRVDQPLLVSKVLFDLAVHPLICQFVEFYFQHDSYLADVDMRRVYPISMAEFEAASLDNQKGYSSSHWHYDVRGPQLKAMIYLQDVTEQDQNFAYLPGTHRADRRIHRSLVDYDSSRFGDDWPQKNGFKVVEAYAKAGTVLLFDTNAVHRLRRKPTNERSSVTFYYTPGQHLRHFSYDPNWAQGLSDEQVRFFRGVRS